MNRPAEADHELPRERWTLSAPESLVLLWGPDTGDAWAVKVALLELVVREAYRLRAQPRRRLLRGTTAIDILIPALALDTSVGHPLRIVCDVAPAPTISIGGDTGIPARDVARALLTRNFRRVRVRPWRRAWDSAGGGYVAADVLPALAARGLYTRDHTIWIGASERRQWVLSPAGVAALEELRAMMATGRGAFPQWAANDPPRAVRYLDLAGPSLLLLGGLAPSLERLSRHAASGAGDDWPALGDLEAGLTALDALAGTLGPGPTDGLDAAFVAISADVDRAWDEVHRHDALFGSSGE